MKQAQTQPSSQSFTPPQAGSSWNMDSPKASKFIITDMGFSSEHLGFNMRCHREDGLEDKTKNNLGMPNYDLRSDTHHGQGSVIKNFAIIVPGDVWMRMRFYVLVQNLQDAPGCETQKPLHHSAAVPASKSPVVLFKWLYSSGGTDATSSSPDFHCVSVPNAQLKSIHYHLRRS
ncbi:hypothetical protein PAAG_02955 [Paracoccidioides lutzii Pb01]|uniref:Uncharacterized protein n=1 Tax=Paracoccidioides lutzii (strain ATCC MYA-826 / Pb01) TaxID=502779 RepID=C1GWR0_PARBA|nr:hypothetical protein PAAG_02955 [Paracoccidioides lutzii Pb01]EEH40979.2 hypothetical protein PAAG_02955 [Paracoccidioides lutzii Pb01]